MSNGLRRSVPWWLRMVLKIVLARLPVSYGWWKRLRLFEHGTMDDPAAALDTLLMHARSAQLIDDDLTPPHFLPRADFAVLELGPGDSLAVGIAAKALGAARSVLIDAGDFARRDVVFCRAVMKHLVAQGYAEPAPLDVQDVEAVLHACALRYLTNGVDSLSSLPDASIDFCLSNAVLEHIPKQDFARLARELRRVLRHDGVSVHRIDFQDHLGGGLNNLRFSERVWEGHLFRNSGFYTNRLRPSEVLACFASAGFAVEILRVLRWPQVPIERRALAAPFSAASEDDLLIYGMDIRLRHRNAVSHTPGVARR